MKSLPVVWGTLVGIFLAAVCTASAMMLPLGRRTRFLDPELAIAIAMPAAVVALTVGLLLVALRPPSRQGFAATAETFGITVGVLHMLIFGYRLIVGAGDGRGFTPGIVHVWWAYAAAASALLAVFALRVDRARRSLTPRHGPGKRGIRAMAGRRRSR
ncbi:hypothetical protein [Pseudoclavibacter sp. RFBB5]|uniref:hypothetical protein n=1 Tax=Pseudoclavibacter sp. RFBB5 TaxID=2080574 RepID=UPI000CE78789|nr:hypothetical protein [Pseudoclavibacter sp. RFBB5]PPG32099.1 hypothetical protein C5B97_03260 [Pseudoclavibacter sp. RFBB5]